MDHITSRQNKTIQNLRMLAKDAAVRTEQQLYVCDGMKFLQDAIRAEQTIVNVFWKEMPELQFSDAPGQYVLSKDLFDYISPLKNSPGPVFTVAMQPQEKMPVSRAIILEDVQDPGNVGTIIRAANAMDIPAVVLCGNCADLYHPRTVRATMGAIFRQKVLIVPDVRDLTNYVIGPIYGAALSKKSVDIRTMDLTNCSVVIGSEGHGLTDRILQSCERTLIIPMDPNSESLNAASAASILMWEMARSFL